MLIVSFFSQENQSKVKLYKIAKSYLSGNVHSSLISKFVNKKYNYIMCVTFMLICKKKNILAAPPFKLVPVVEITLLLVFLNFFYGPWIEGLGKVHLKSKIFFKPFTLIINCCVLC